MTVTEFDIVKGVYTFQLQELETEFHAHPAIEIVFADDECLTIETEQSTYNGVSGVIIDSNIKHRISGKSTSIQLSMIEHRDSAIKDVLSSLEHTFKHGVCILKSNTTHQHAFKDLAHKLINTEYKLAYDSRVTKVINHLMHNDVAYDQMLSTLTQLVHLSESRLSHLFKEDVGISLKKYLLWCKLKSTIYQHLDKKEDLFASLIQSGFYDQPHFSKAFKTMLGVAPSKAYNSRTVQG